MFSYAKIISHSGNVCTLGCSRSCTSCRAELFCSSKGTTFEASLPDGVSVKDGDMVKLYLPPPATVGATVLTFLLPLAMFFIGLVIGRWGLNSDTLAAALALLLMGGGFVAVRAFSNRFTDQMKPEILGVVTPSEAEGEGL